jgi:hypothetical protein
VARGAARSAAVHRADALNLAQSVWRRLLPHLTRRRIVALLLLAIVCTTWLRTEVARCCSAPVAVTRLASTAAASGDFTVLGLWQLQALTENFGGFSAMAVRGPLIRLFSDQGRLLTIARPDQPALSDTVPTLRLLFPTSRPFIELLDIESTTFDPDSGRFWVGYENHDTIYRYSVSGEPESFVEPAFAANWGDNSGIEAMVRLVDGRFVVLKETGGLGFLYPGDPTEGAEPLHFRIDWPGDYHPVDMAELPDGRVLILMRRLGWHIPVFESQLAVADPAQIDADHAWPITPLLQLESLLPRDNYEGLAVEPEGDGSLTLWLASDDNHSVMQRSLLAKLRWTPDSPEAESTGPESHRTESRGQ